MGKSLTESAAEILNASLGSATKEPMQGGNQAQQIGGVTPTDPDSGIQNLGASAASPVKVAPKPGQGGAPAEPPKTLGGKPKVIADENEIKNESVEEDGEEITEEELDAFLDTLSEEELDDLLSEMQQADADLEVISEEEGDDDEDDDTSDDDDDTSDDDDDIIEEGVDLTDEQIAEARTASIKERVQANMQSCKEDIDALFNGESLSEEFQVKATTIFEAAVRARVESVLEQIVVEQEEQLEALLEDMQAKMTDQVDQYLSYVVEQWMEENKLAVDTGLRSEIAEDFMTGLKALFEEHYIDVPEGKDDLVEELATMVAERDTTLEEQAATIVEITKALNESKSQEILRQICEGLTEMQVQKIKALAEGVEFTTEGDYKEKLEVIRENYFPSKVARSAAPQTIVETDNNEAPVSDAMSRYVQAITKQVPK